MSDDDLDASTGSPSASERGYRPWWKTPDSPSRALVVGCLFAVGAIGSWILVAQGAGRWAFHVLLALMFSVFAVRSLATWLSGRKQRK